MLERLQRLVLVLLFWDLSSSFAGATVSQLLLLDLLLVRIQPHPAQAQHLKHVKTLDLYWDASSNASHIYEAFG